MSSIPKEIFFVQGIGYHSSELGSFEQALRAAGIAEFNLVEVSSILPPNCIEVSRTDGLAKLSPGQIVFSVISRVSSKKTNQLITASIGVAKPQDTSLYGYLCEYQAVDQDPEKAGEYAENLATEMLSTTLGIPFDPKANYDEKIEFFKINGNIIGTKNITKSGTVSVDIEWLTVLAAAIFII
jgi:arginine decarboxylase